MPATLTPSVATKPSKLESALAWAARGFRVFPVAENTRDTPIEAGWTRSATTDPDTIRRWWTCPVTHWPRDYNIGCLTTDMIVLDLDVKKGKRGIESFVCALGLDFDTLTARTPSGGLHVYYRGPNAAGTVDILGPGSGVDIRSWDNYVLAPGSEIDGKPYTVELDLPVADAPAPVRRIIKLPRPERVAVSHGVAQDTPEAVATAEHWLRHNAPLAVEGQGGDATTFRVCARLVRDFALSPAMALSLLAEDWNARCDPPWDLAELDVKLRNAESYASGDEGAAHPSVLFGELRVTPPEYEKPLSAVGEFAFGNLARMASIAPRPWVYPRLLMRKQVTVLTAPGAAGKSTFQLTAAVHAALGLDFLGHKCMRPGKTIIYNAEDDMDEMARRLYGLCHVYNFDPAKVIPNICFMSGQDAAINVTVGAPPVLNRRDVEPLIAAASAPDVTMVCIGPLVELHQNAEDDNTAMKYVMGVLRGIARLADVALLVDHHTRKPGNAASGGFVGSADASRGASSIINSARIALTLFPADVADVERFGIPEDDRHLYVRLDDAKMNNAAPTASNKPTWLYRETARLINGDEVGVLVRKDVSQELTVAAMQLAKLLYTEMTGAALGFITITQAVAYAQGGDPLLERLPASTVKGRIERYLARPVTMANGASVQFQRDHKSAGVRII